MKHVLLVFTLVMICSLAAAQEGPEYIGLQKGSEKVHNVKQKHGKNVLTLDATSTMFYDAEGSIVEKYIMKGNKTYNGKMLINKRQDPATIETLHYNHMNLLAGRSVEYAEPQSRESTLIEYDAKGKVLCKTSTRETSHSPEYWEMHYNQVGYVASYAQVRPDDRGKIMEKRVFDFKDDLQEIQAYSYDAQDNLTEIIAVSPQDTVMYRMNYRYDDAGYLVEEQKYDNLNQILQSVSYAYDHHHRLLQRSEFYWNPRYGRIPNLRQQIDYSYE